METGRLPSSWKKANVLPIHKKGNRQLKKIIGPPPFYLFAENFFEKLMFYPIYEHLCANQPLTRNQSGFRTSDSTVNQLLSFTHKIYSALEEFPSRETRAVFLDISKTFDKVWHDGILFKLQTYGISGSPPTTTKDFLSNRQQRVILNGKSSGWSSITAGVPGVQFSDLRQDRFRHRFHCSNPMCLCQMGIEGNEHFLLHCPLYTNYRKDLFDRLSNIVDRNLDSLTSIYLCN